MEWIITGSNWKSFGEVDHLASIVSTSLLVSALLVLVIFWLIRKPGGQRAVHRWCLVRDTYWNQYSIGQQEYIGSLSKFLSSWATLPTPSWHPQSVLADVTVLQFHFTPFNWIWKKACGCEEYCFDELYTSNAWLDEYDKLLKQPNEPVASVRRWYSASYFGQTQHMLPTLGLRVYGHYIYILVTCQNIFGTSQDQELPIMWHISPWSVPIFVIFLYHIIYHCLLMGSWLCTWHHPEQQPESKHPYTLLPWIDAWCLDEATWWWFCKSLLSWVHNAVPRQCMVLVLSTNIYLFSGLSWKVAFLHIKFWPGSNHYIN